MGMYCPNCGKDGVKWTEEMEETPEGKRKASDRHKALGGWISYHVEEVN